MTVRLNEPLQVLSRCYTGIIDPGYVPFSHKKTYDIVSHACVLFQLISKPQWVTIANSAQNITGATADTQVNGTLLITCVLCVEIQ